MNDVPRPQGWATVNPVALTQDPDRLIDFMRHVFGGHEHTEARTTDIDGLLIHAEFQIGEVTFTIGERKPGWPHLPLLAQVYVPDVRAALARAVEKGAEIITEPTDLYGFLFSRVLDPLGNMWWVYEHGEAPDIDWSDDSDDPGEEWEDPGLAYIQRTLVEVLPRLGEDPTAAGE